VVGLVPRLPAAARSSRPRLAPPSPDQPQRPRPPAPLPNPPRPPLARAHLLLRRLETNPASLRPDIRPHECRHPYVTHLRVAGVNGADLAEIAGYRVETILARYTHSVGVSFAQCEQLSASEKPLGSPWRLWCDPLVVSCSTTTGERTSGARPS
jgi:hypothetical protein